MVKILFDGVVFHPTGVATHHRNLLLALQKKGVPIHVIGEPYLDGYGEGTEKFWSAFNALGEDVFQFLTYHPTEFRKRRWARHKVGMPVHEGSKLWDGWADLCNKFVDRLVVPSKATKNLFFSEGVRVPIHVVPEGVDDKKFNLEAKPANLNIPDEYKKKFKEKPFVFLSVNSWTGKENDRKGTDLLVKAFAEEFSNEDNVVLYLKVSTFWAPPYDLSAAINNLKIKPLSKRAVILIDQSMIDSEKLPSLYRMADCFVAPTRGESWGLTIGEAMACGLPVILTKNPEAGYTDFVGDFPLWVETEGREQADRNFYCEGNMMPRPSIESLRKQMRAIYEMSKEKRDKLGKEGSDHMRNKFNWNLAAQKLIDVLEEVV